MIVFILFLLWGTDTILILWEVMGICRQFPHLLYASKPFELFYGPLVYCHFRILWIIIAVTGYTVYYIGHVPMIKVMLVIYYFIEKKHEKVFLRIQEDSSETRYKKTMVGNINTYRIGAAKKRLLEDKDTSILQTALQCGFNSKNTFNTAFSSLEGMTPTEFMEKNR